MVRWTGKWAEKEIDRAAQRLGGDKQFKKKKRVEKSKPREAGVYTHKGTAARIDAAAAPAPASAKRTLPGLAPPGGHDDYDAPQIVAPEDAVCSSERARLAAEPAPVASAAALVRRPSRTRAVRGVRRSCEATEAEPAPPRRATRRCFLLRRTRRMTHFITIAIFENLLVSYRPLALAVAKSLHPKNRCDKLQRRCARASSQCFETAASALRHQRCEKRPTPAFFENPQQLLRNSAAWAGLPQQHHVWRMTRGASMRGPSTGASRRRSKSDASDGSVARGLCQSLRWRTCARSASCSRTVAQDRVDAAALPPAGAERRRATRVTRAARRVPTGMTETHSPPTSSRHEDIPLPRRGRRPQTPRRWRRCDRRPMPSAGGQDVRYQL